MWPNLYLFKFFKGTTDLVTFTEEIITDNFIYCAVQFITGSLVIFTDRDTLIVQTVATFGDQTRKANRSNRSWVFHKKVFLKNVA